MSEAGSQQTEMKGLTGIADRTWQDNILFSVLLELTYRCNLDCHFCYNDTSLKGTPLAKEQYFELLDDLAAMNVLNLTLSGGEPLAHPHFFAVGARGKELGFLVRVKSNGHALRGVLARRLKEEVDPFSVEVSLHGASADVHDRQTRVAGSFDRLLANIEEMQRAGLRVQINSTLTAWNEHQVGEMMEIADRFGVAILIDPEVTPRDNGDKSPLDIRPSVRGIENFYGLLRERAAQGGSTPQVGPEGDTAVAAVASDKHCGAGSSTLAIDPYGEVYPCVQWRWSVGNLHRQSIRELWGDTPVLESVREANRQAKRLVDAQGEPGKAMGFCPGAAWINTGNPTEFHQIPKEKMQAYANSQAQSRRELLPVLQ